MVLVPSTSLEANISRMNVLKSFEKLEIRHSQLSLWLNKYALNGAFDKNCGCQNKLSKAIEFARAGSSVDDIVQGRD